MKSVHTNEKSKYAVAVYEVAHGWPVKGAEGGLQPFVEGLFPQSWGRNVSAGELFSREDTVKYTVLVANRKQTTPNDIERRLRERGAADATVTAIIAVPQIGGVEPEPGSEDEPRRSPARPTLDPKHDEARAQFQQIVARLMPWDEPEPYRSSRRSKRLSRWEAGKETPDEAELRRLYEMTEPEPDADPVLKRDRQYALEAAMEAKLRREAWARPEAALV